MSFLEIALVFMLCVMVVLCYQETTEIWRLQIRIRKLEKRVEKLEP